MSLFTKTVSPCDGGVNSFKRPFAIDLNQWVSLSQLRCKNGLVQNFPGWASILSAGSMASPGTFGWELNRSDGATIYVFGDYGKLYKVAAGLLVDITGGLSLPSSPDAPWSGAQYRNFLYLMHRINGLYKYDSLLSTFVLLANAPRAVAVGVLNDHILAFNVLSNPTVYPSGISNVDPQLLAWGAEGSETDWSPTGANDAGSFLLSNTSGPGLALVPLGNDMIAYKTDELVTLTFVGGNEVFGVSARNGATGLLGPRAFANCFNYHVFMGQHSVCRFDGGQQLTDDWALPVRDLIYNNLHPVYKNRSLVCYFPTTGEILIAWPSLVSTGLPNTAVVWAIDEELWYGPFPFPATALAPPAKNDILFADGIGDICRLSDATQSAKGTPITRSCETGDQFVGTQAMPIDGGPAVNFPPGMVFNVSRLRFEYEPTAGWAAVQIGWRMALSGPLTYEPADTIDLSSINGYDIPHEVAGRWFRLLFHIPNSYILKLAGYQWEFSPTGRY